MDNCINFITSTLTRIHACNIAVIRFLCVSNAIFCCCHFLFTRDDHKKYGVTGAIATFCQHGRQIAGGGGGVKNCVCISLW